MMKRLRAIIIAAIAVCILALTCAWWAVSNYADRHARKMLGHSCEVFETILETSLGSTLWYVASLGAYYLDYSATPVSVERMQQLAEILYVDEFTVVGTNGIAVASNYREYIGFDWHTTPETAEYLKLFEPHNQMTYLAQPFRNCVIEHNNYRKFCGVVFTNRLGLVQVGYSMDRLVEVMKLADAQAFSTWRFGRHGRFGAFDCDGDGLPDPADPAASAGVPTQVVIDGVSWQRLAFPFAGRMFYAEVPEREFGDQRDAAFQIAAIIIVVLISLFTFILARLRLASDKVEKLHREAEQRAADDLKLAHAIQMSTLPRVAAFNAGFSDCRLDAVMIPAREVGGDFYDFFMLADGRVAFVIGDVSGKGVPAAMFMLVAKNAIRRALHDQGDLAVAMAMANEILGEDNEAGMFVTMVLGVLNPATGEVMYVNAGHNRPLVVRANGEVERLEVRGGRLLGLFSGLKYCATPIRLNAGDRLFLYTDGVTEAMDAAGRLYGEARLKALLATQPDRVCAAVRADVNVHVAGTPASDDLTMLEIVKN